MDSGIASPTNSALRAPMKTSRTTTTRMKPETMLFSSSLIMDLM